MQQEIEKRLPSYDASDAGAGAAGGTAASSQPFTFSGSFSLGTASVDEKKTTSPTLIQPFTFDGFSVGRNEEEIPQQRVKMLQNKTPKFQALPIPPLGIDKMIKEGTCIEIIKERCLLHELDSLHTESDHILDWPSAEKVSTQCAYLSVPAEKGKAVCHSEEDEDEDEEEEEEGVDLTVTPSRTCLNPAYIHKQPMRRKLNLT